MRLVSWNVNGLRAALRKGGIDDVLALESDVLCLQETKASADVFPSDVLALAAYDLAFCAGERKGYSGTATYSLSAPKAQFCGFGGDPAYDREGRIMGTDHGDFVLLNIYFPNGKQNDERLAYKMGFYEATLAYCEQLRADGRSVIICGDVNTAHRAIDLARPKGNEKVSGFLPEERAWMDRFLARGYIDTYRHVHGDKTDAYSWWSMRTGARERNVGWRLDYFFVSEDLADRIAAAEIHPGVYGSDHCPVSLDLN
ncbi:MAG: exodeoxyribonuclease-3 [Rhodothermales bacterium]|jgi:exodeoxyribonuclease-3